MRAEVRIGSWPRGNALEGGVGGTDGAVAPPCEPFRGYFFRFGLEAIVVRPTRILSSSEAAQPASRGRIRFPSPRSAA